MPRRRSLLPLVLLLALAALATACEPGPQERLADERQELLVGTWLRTYEEDGVSVRRVLVLDADGAFREMASVQVPQGSGLPAAATASGRWLFDGTNLKRHYRQVNGQPMSAPQMPFATFEVRFASRRQFIGLDRIRRIEVVYDRVPDGTEP